MFDYVFFIANDIKVNMNLLRNKLLESDYIKENDEFNIDILKEMLINKFREINYDEAKEDVISFVKNSDSLDTWSKEFFINITEKLEEKLN